MLIRLSLLLRMTLVVSVIRLISQSTQTVTQTDYNRKVIGNQIVLRNKCALERMIQRRKEMFNAICVNLKAELEEILMNTLKLLTSC